MHDHISDYKAKLEKGLCEYMAVPVSEHSAEAVKHLCHAWMAVDKLGRKMDKGGFTHADAKSWADCLKNADGTTGPHWTIEQTTAVAEGAGVEFTHIDAWCWWITINMIYSDYCAVADRFGVGTTEFYAEMAKAFLFDADGPAPMQKLATYYHGIVEQ